ncbi:MAG: PAS domain S-box protein, partial [Methanomicrobiales archaeon]
MVNERDMVPRILDVIRVAGRPLTISAISRQAGLDRHTVSHILEILRLRGQILFLHQGMAKKYYCKENSSHTIFPTASTDLIIIVDQALNLLYVNEVSGEYAKDSAKNLAGKKLDSLRHPVLHHPEFFVNLQEASFQKVVHFTQVISSEVSSLAYPVTIITIDIPDKGPGVLIIIEEAFVHDGAPVPLNRELIEQLSPGIIVANVQGEILHVNPSFLQSTGYPDELEIVGHTITDFIGENPYLLDTIHHPSTSHDHFHEMILKRRDGSQVFCLMHWELVRSPSDIPLYISGIMLDMSGRGELKEKIATLEERFRDIVQGIPDVIWETGTDFCYTYISPAITAMTGYHAGELMGNPPLWLSSNEKNEKTRRIFSEASPEGSVIITGEHSLEHKDGHRVIVETRAIPLFSTTGVFRGYRGIDRDITERKRTEETLLKNTEELNAALTELTASEEELRQNVDDLGKSEQALRESEEKHRCLIEESSDPIFSFTPEGRYTYANRALAEGFGKPVKEIIGKSIRDFFPKDEAERRLTVLQEVFCTGEKGLIEGYVPRANGSRYYVTTISPVKDDKGSVISAIGTSKDLTERKLVEEAMQENDEKMALVMDGVPALLCYIDADLRYVYVNKAYTDWYGQNRQEIIGKQISDLMDAEMFERVLPHYQNVLSGNNVSYEICNCNAVGEKYFLSVRYIPYFKQGRVAGFFALMLDITGRKVEEEILAAALKRTRDQQQALGTISFSPCLFSGDVYSLSARLTEVSAGVLGVERASVWLFNRKGDELQCIDLYEALCDRHTYDHVLKRCEYVHEFDLLSTAQYIDAHDPLTDPRTAGYVECYLKSNRITSMLDAVIRVSGKDLGVLRFEHVNRPHHWESDEIAFACQLADQVAITLLNRDRKCVEDALRESEYKFHAIFDSTFEFMALLRPDGNILEVNETALQFGGFALSNVIHKPFWEARWWTLSPEIKAQLK